MPFDASELAASGLEASFLDWLLTEHQTCTLPRLQRLWDYYRNPARGDEADEVRPHQLAQARRLPSRFHATRTDSADLPAGAGPREVVVENDIAWRLHTLVDFMFGRTFVVQSLADDPTLAQRIESFLHAAFTANGGIGLFQDLALLGSVYGHVDLLLRLDATLPAPMALLTPGAAPARELPTAQALQAQAARFLIEIIDAPRAIPVLHPTDYRRFDAYVLHYTQLLNQVAPEGILGRLRRRWLGLSGDDQRATVACTEVWTDAQVSVFHDGKLVEEALNPLGRLPIVHIQNLAQPFFYEGLSEVEPLIPLQDELNTRLSDRANRVTLQSFKMYLGKGIEGFTERPVGPGQMWATDNLQASIQEFGGDGQSPSEDAHINEIRDAMDKTSGVNAVAAGLLRDKVGNLTSATALRVVLMGLLAKTQRRRVTYGAGIERLCELLLHAADVTGVLPNAPQDRRLRIDWPSPIPESTRERLQEAQLKLQIGVPREQVLVELGYGEFVQAPTAG